MNAAQIKLAAVVTAACLAAALIGTSIAVLPPVLAIALALFFFTPVFFVSFLHAPELKDPPYKQLHWLFIAAVFLYFVWPRNAFIPISALPVKHPQKILYFALLAFFFYALAKCKPLQDQLSKAIQDNRILFGSWLTLGLWQFISASFSNEPGYSIARAFNDLVSLYLLLPLAVCCVRDQRDANRMIFAIVAAACINVGYAGIESLLKQNIFAPFISIGEIDPAVAKQILAEKIRGGSYRAQASFDHPILFAEFLCLTLPFALTYFLIGKRRVLSFISCILILCGLALSQSRTAVVAGSIAAAVTILTYSLVKRRTNAYGGGIGALLLLSPLLFVAAYYLGNIGLSFVFGRSFAENSSTESRLQMLYEGLEFLKSSWLLGYGPGIGGYALNFASGDGVLTLDNYYLLLALDAGVPALLLFSTFLFTMLKICATNVRQSTLLTAVIGSLVALGLIKSILGTNLNNIIIPILACISIAHTQRKT